MARLYKDLYKLMDSLQRITRNRTGTFIKYEIKIKINDLQ